MVSVDVKHHVYLLTLQFLEAHDVTVFGSDRRKGVTNRRLGFDRYPGKEDEGEEASCLFSKDG